LSFIEKDILFGQYDELYLSLMENKIIFYVKFYPSSNEDVIQAICKWL